MQVMVDEAIGYVKDEYNKARLKKNETDKSTYGCLLSDIEAAQKGKKDFTILSFYELVAKHLAGAKIMLNEVNKAPEKFPNQSVVDLMSAVEKLEELLPRQLTFDELEGIITGLIGSMGDKAGIGPVMGHLKANYPHQYDSKMAMSIIREQLEN